MAVRSSMADLITHLRLLANDQNSDEFTDQELQDVLDQHAYVAGYEQMTPIENITSEGVTEYKAFQSERLYFDTDAKLYNTSYSELTPDTSDYKLAYFTFSTSQDLPVLIYGWWYDMNAAAANVWELKASKYASLYDFDADGGDYKLSQKADAARKRAADFRAQSVTASQVTLIQRIDVAQ